MENVVGIDIGATNTRIAVVGAKGNVIERSAYKTEPRGLMNTIIKELEGFPTFDAIGVSSIGPLDANRGIILNPSNVKIRNLKVVELLQKRFGLPCHLFNDCVAGVMAERFFGAGGGVKNLVYITISTGIGAGVIANDRLVLGKDGNAHEVGHFKIDYNSPIKDTCGNYGCWEAFCSGKGIPMYVNYLLKTKYKSRASKLKGARNLNAKVFFEYAKKDRVASEIADRIGKINAIGIANVVDAYDPELITIGGSVMLNNSKRLMKQITRFVGRYALNRTPRIAVTTLGHDICLLGAAAGVLHRDWVNR